MPVAAAVTAPAATTGAAPVKAVHKTKKVVRTSTDLGKIAKRLGVVGKMSSGFKRTLAQQVNRVNSQVLLLCKRLLASHRTVTLKPETIYTAFELLYVAEGENNKDLEKALKETKKAVEKYNNSKQKKAVAAVKA